MSLELFLNRSQLAYARLITLCESVFPCFRFNDCSSVFEVHTCYGTWPTLLLHCPPQGGGRVFLLGIKGMHVGKLLCVGHQGRLAGCGYQCPVLGLLVLCVRKVFFHPVLGCALPGDSDTKMQWAGVFGLPLLATGIVMTFSIPHGVGAWLWFC